MLDALVTAMASWPLSSALRKSQWIYPLVNTGHVLGLALLVGAVTTLDVRLLGAGRTVALAPAAQLLIRVARVGFVLAVTMGALLFITRPADYAFNRLFQIKLLLISVALVNMYCLHRSVPWRALMAGGDAVDGPVHPRIQFAAMVSMLAWLGVLLAGRLIGYR
jgi:hypothetical protein